MNRLILTAAAIALAAVAVSAAGDNRAGDRGADDMGYAARQLLVTDSDVLGRPIEYPKGHPRITSAIVTIPPGGSGKLHRHKVPMYAYVLEGDVTVDYGKAGTRVFHKGDAIIEAQEVAHRGMNKGTGQVALLVVYMGAEGTPDVELAK
ncbi:MAG: cupin domain-containing protein [Alphaproteobacteria bacterium]|nr:cupin domain-containing protein [Alphaproteobacteria bacterium]